MYNSKSNFINRNNFNRSGNKVQEPRKADEEFFNKINENYADEAEKVIQDLQEKMLSVSSIRNILELINNVRERMVFEKESISKSLQNEIQYIRVKVSYMYGRGDSAIKNFIDKSKIMELVLCIGDNKNKFEIFAKYVEALVAFHKFYGGKDN
ncbi:MAG: type III-A CRISPR-associated protein Csm2 [Clostridia bacterium]|nr:type III-A CRISPR-associated protein Csm2 [Clostridia bacterium]